MQLLYGGAADMEESGKNRQVIYEEAVAIYNVTYEYAAKTNSVEKCSFAWKVAGTALCNLCACRQSKDKPLTILPSLVRDLLN